MTFTIMPHGRLQEWVAEEKGFFAGEGLDYAFVTGGDYGIHVRERDGSGEIRTGAFETFEAGRDGANVSCACHWATSAAASDRSGQLVTSVYSVAPCAIVVPPESPVRRPEDLAGVPFGVGYHSGSHFTTVQALEAVIPAEQITLAFQGPPNERLDALLDRQVPAAAVHYHLRAVPEKYRDRVDVRAFGTGERIVFLPYTEDVFTATRQWVTERGLLGDAPPAPAAYDQARL